MKQQKSQWVWIGIIAVLLSARVSRGEADEPRRSADVWQRIAPDFQPPDELARDFGEYRSPLEFYDGRPVRTAEDWAERREEILRRWQALNHTVAVNRLLGYTNRVAMTNRPGHGPTPESNEQMYLFFAWFLQHSPE